MLYVVAIYVLVLVCVAFMLGMRGWLRVLLETLDMSVSHSWECTCSAMAIVCTCFGSVLYDTSCQLIKHAAMLV